MNKLDKEYQSLLQDILDNGTKKTDRTGTGTISVFSREIRHKMSDGFPLLTTKKMPFKTILIELIWFLRGDTNIKYLVDNGCNIWNGDAYKRFYKEATKIKDAYKDGDLLGTQSHIEEMFSNPYELIILTIDEFVNKIKNDNEFAKKWGELGPIYGRQWRNWKTDKVKMEYTDMGPGMLCKSEYPIYIDQIKNLISDIKNNPDSRRLMVNAWNVGEIDQMTLPPCHYGFQVYTRELSLEERIEWMGGKIQEKYPALIKQQIEHCDKHNVPKRAISLKWTQRSCDFPLGIPFNIASYGLLLEILAKIVNMVPDELIGSLGDCHIYLNQVDGCKEQLVRESYQLPYLTFMKTDNFFKELSNDISLLNILDYPDFRIEGYQSQPTIKFPLSN